jgi:hypothetical protein
MSHRWMRLLFGTNNLETVDGPHSPLPYGKNALDLATDYIRAVYLAFKSALAD